MIYFAQNTLTKKIKIGYSQNVKKRRSGLQTSAGEEIVVLGTIYGVRIDEQELHERFARFRLHGEWFAPAILPEVQRLIARNPADKTAPTCAFVVGDRHFKYRSEVDAALDALHAQNPVAWVITADDQPLDRWAIEWAGRNGARVYRYATNWNRYGRGAPRKAHRHLLGAQFDPKTFLLFAEGEGKNETQQLADKARKKGYAVGVRSVPLPKPRLVRDVGPHVVVDCPLTVRVSVGDMR